MPVTSVRDIVVHGDGDLDVATFGRGFWVMDQMAALREIAAQGSQIATTSAYLFKPGETYGIRASSANGTPMPHEDPQLQNPPSGVIAYCRNKTTASQPVKLELVDSFGRRTCLRCQRHTSASAGYQETLNVQAIWMQPAQPPSATAGMHRFAIGGSAGRGGGFGRGAVAAPRWKNACTPAGAAADAAAASKAPPAAEVAGDAAVVAAAGAVVEGAPRVCSPGQYALSVSRWMARPSLSRSPSSPIRAEPPPARTRAHSETTSKPWSASRR